MRSSRAALALLLVVGCSLTTDPDLTRLDRDGGASDTNTSDSNTPDGDTPDGDTPDTARSDTGDCACRDGVSCTIDECGEDECVFTPMDSLCPEGQRCARSFGCVDRPCPDEDGDTVCDADDLCPGRNDLLDRDDDGIPNACDLCPGEDDRVDRDGDGIPDGCDECPEDPNPDCSAVSCPGVGEIPLPMDSGAFRISEASLNGRGNVINVPAGDRFQLRLVGAGRNCSCPGCRHQLEVGFDESMRFEQCAYDDAVGCDMVRAFEFETTMTAPMEPGVHRIVVSGNIGFGCPGDRRWPLFATKTPIAAICVTR